MKPVDREKKNSPRQETVVLTRTGPSFSVDLTDKM